MLSQNVLISEAEDPSWEECVGVLYMVLTPKAAEEPAASDIR